MLDGQFVDQRGCQREKDLEFVLVGASILDHFSIVSGDMGWVFIRVGVKICEYIHWRESTEVRKIEHNVKGQG